jgi:LytS/YehU family sensor histidine kinase
LQPFIENALWHGLMHKKGDRNLNVAFTLESQDVLLCKISDNGIGREQAARIKKSSIKSYQSMGTKIIRDRMELMKKQSNVFDLQIIDETDQKGNPCGTTVVIKIPVGIDEPQQESAKAFRPAQVDVVVNKEDIRNEVVGNQ